MISILSFAISFLVVLTFLAVKVELVKISPVFSAFEATLILSKAFIFFVFFKAPSIFNLASVATIPSLVKFLTSILFLAINFPVVLVSFALNLSPVDIFPVFSVFSATNIFSFACMFPLLINLPSICISFFTCISLVFFKSLVYRFSFVYMADLLSTFPSNIIFFSAWVPLPLSFILSAFIFISRSDCASPFCS